MKHISKIQFRKNIQASALSILIRNDDLTGYFAV
jgi:hypothetical protein